MWKDGMKRREFLRNGSIAALTAGLALPLARSVAQDKNEKPKLVCRTLGRTQLRVPVVSFGVMNSDSPDLLKKALQMGINHFDTAFVYLRGNSEKSLGNVIKEAGMRGKVSIATKVWLAHNDDKGTFSPTTIGRQPGATKENFFWQLDASLERLGTNYVDILYVHSCDTAQMVSDETMMNAALEAKKLGKTRFIGVSCHSKVPEVVRAAVDAKIYDVVEIAFNYLREDKNEIEQAIKYAKKHDIGVVAMKTQGGEREKGDTTPINHQAMLKWVLNHEEVSTAIPGMTTFDQLDLNISVMANLALTEQEKKELHLSAKGSGRLFCQSCRSCVPQCPQRVNIPHLMRAYMYSQNYGNLIQAEITLDELPIQNGLAICRDCGHCSADCRLGIPIGRRVQALLLQHRSHA